MELKKIVMMLKVVLVLAGTVSGLSLSEIESNPAGSDSGNEWLEIYSPVALDLDGYILENEDGNSFALDGSIDRGYSVIEFESQFLDNSGCQVFLKYEGEVLDQSPVISDSDNDAMAWSWCGDVWLFGLGTPGEENSCQNQCLGDFDSDGYVGTTDFLALLADWGKDTGADLDGDGNVGQNDMDILLDNWGECDNASLVKHMNPESYIARERHALQV